MNWKDKLANRWTLIVAAIGILGYLGLDASGLRPTWFFEHSALAADFYDAECGRIKREWYIAKDLAEGYLRRGEPVPSWLREKMVYLESELNRYKCKGEAR